MEQMSFLDSYQLRQIKSQLDKYNKKLTGYALALEHQGTNKGFYKPALVINTIATNPYIRYSRPQMEFVLDVRFPGIPLLNEEEVLQWQSRLSLGMRNVKILNQNLKELRTLCYSFQISM